MNAGRRFALDDQQASGEQFLDTGEQRLGCGRELESDQLEQRLAVDGAG